MKMEPIVSSETSAIRTQTPGNYPKRNNLHLLTLFGHHAFGMIHLLAVIHDDESQLNRRTYILLLYKVKKQGYNPLT